ncbi:hypothetical protein VU10_03610 [Desulfobulbus sp. US1]|jgi:hypothetical protein|nr:hypothetical protein [Desulfobulbus sp. US4]MCW5208144.1 hypothetical protein [Desulfobulbus sp. US2]MCW5209277.1 hypothetical protein [Desulfobulbus sp. US1]
MSENVQLAFVITVGLVIVVCFVIAVLKDKFRSGDIKVNRDGVQGSVATHAPAEPPVTKITGTTIKGNENAVSARDGAQVEDSDIEGDKNRLSGND